MASPHRSRGDYEGSTSPSARASKPLATALDTTLSILMDDKVSDLREHFEDTERRAREQQEQIKELTARVAKIERTHREELGRQGRAHEEQMAEQAEAHAQQLAEHLAETERLVAEELGKVELQLEGKCGLADVEQLTERAEEMDRLFGEEVQKRHTEVGEINEVLKGLETLFEMWDEKMAQQRRVRIEAQLRKAIFHMQHKVLTGAFNSWSTWYRQLKKRRHLLTRGVGSWRNRLLASYWRPWHAMWRCEHSKRMKEAIDAIDRDRGLTQALETRIHNLTAQLDEGLVGDEALQEALETMEEQLHGKATELNEKMEKHAEHLHDKFDDGHRDLAESIEAMEAQLQESSDELLQDLESRLAEVHETLDGKHSALSDELNALDAVVEGNHQQLVRWLGKQRQATIESRCRVAVLRMQAMFKSKAFQAWSAKYKHAKRIKYLQFRALLFMKNRRAVLIFNRWAAAARVSSKAKHHEQLLHSLSSSRPDPAEVADLVDSRLDELAQKVSQTVSKLKTKVTETQQQVTLHDDKIDHLYEELGKQPEDGTIAREVGQQLQDEFARQKHRQIQSALTNVAKRWMHRGVAAAFGTLKAHARKKKRVRNLSKKAIYRMEHRLVARAVLPWLHAARMEQARRTAEAMNTMIQRADQIHTCMTADRSSERQRWIKITLSNIYTRWKRLDLSRAFQSWAQASQAMVKARNSCRRVISRLEHLNVHRCFTPWLAAARADGVSKQLSAIDKIARSASGRLDGAEEKIGQMYSEKGSVRDQMREMGSRLDSIEGAVSNGEFETQVNEQLLAIHEKIEQLDDSPAMLRVRQDLEERLEHLEVALREEFQHVEVRCDIISREFGKLRGKDWKDGLPPSKEVLVKDSGVVSAEITAMQKAFGMLQADIESMRGSISASVASTSQPTTDHSAALAEMRVSLQQMEIKMERFAAFKAVLDSLQGKIDAFHVVVPTQASHGADLAQLKADVGAFEREVSALRSAQEQRVTVDGEQSASIVGIKAEVGGLQQAHGQMQHATRELSATLGEMRSDLAVAKSDAALAHRLQDKEQSAAVELSALRSREEQTAATVSVLQSTVAELQNQVSACVTQDDAAASRAEVQLQLDQNTAEDAALESNVANLTSKLDALSTHLIHQAEQAAATPQPPPSEGLPPVQDTASALEELGTVTRRIASLQLEKEVLSQQGDAESAGRLDEVMQEMQALQHALDQLGALAGVEMNLEPTSPKQEAYPIARPGSAVRRASGSVRGRRTDSKQAAWARAHSHAFGARSNRSADRD
jgi:chromosome segregation ATPase